MGSTIKTTEFNEAERSSLLNRVMETALFACIVILSCAAIIVFALAAPVILAVTALMGYFSHKGGPRRWRQAGV
ncbi:hypothetical protein PUV54_10435 [Hyphococcus flavus]|uniref:Uncharacterized protein n=1 Tax=Hyphococcus flavus TaxID=1866326 RepID=A0AAE9ZAS3_9PROT|nr:hypothetical protein [Hyphococcus flavus]WDI30376.1 hypothetical protein PUV54_10435 [Hyphococcus flavus]